MDCDSNREQLNEIFQLLKSHVNIVSVNLTEHFNVQEAGKYKTHFWWKCTSQFSGLKSFYGAHICICVVFSSSSYQACDSVLCMHGGWLIGAGLCRLVSPRNRLFQAGANCIVLCSCPFCTAELAPMGAPTPAQGSAGQQVAEIWVQDLARDCTPRWQRYNTDRSQFSSHTGESGDGFCNFLL